jgi:NADH dehydrogenase FAD-containing subunit
VLTDRATGIEEDQIILASGARLACDVPILANTDHAPAWLKSSGLAIDVNGSMTVDAHLRATRHPHVFVIGAQNATELAQNLAAVVTGLAPRPRKHPANTLSLLACGDAYAIANWGRHCAQGRWVWWLKDWMDRSFIQRHRKT